MVYAYPEKTLQQKAVAWLTLNSGYRELSNDVEATGARMDSIGLLRNRLIAIEVKKSVISGMSWHREDKPSSLESKFAATLGGLYRDETGVQIEQLSTNWDRSRPLALGVIAESYSSAGYAELIGMMQSRSKEWIFEVFVWQWTGDALIERHYCKPPPLMDGLDWATVKVPSLKGKPALRRKRNLEELRQLAEAGGCGLIFDEFLDYVKRNDDIRLRVQSSGFRIQERKSGGWSTFLSVFLDGDLERGIPIGVDVARITVEDAALTEAPRRGFMNTNFFCKSPEDVRYVFGQYLAPR